MGPVAAVPADLANLHGHLGHGDPGRCGGPRADGRCAASERGLGARRRLVAGHVRDTPGRDQRLLRPNRFLAHLDNRARTPSPGRDRAGARRRGRLVLTVPGHVPGSWDGISPPDPDRREVDGALVLAGRLGGIGQCGSGERDRLAVRAGQNASRSASRSPRFRSAAGSVRSGTGPVISPDRSADMAGSVPWRGG
jgi:hypothetical protein